ncbi:MAG: HNH endonuclease [Acidobacteriia bacterium]|nr:HNH endonuclease [Terriglobia bacterium]
MPSRPATPCRWPGCPALSHERFCPEHQSDEYRRQDANRPSMRERGYTSAWLTLRKEILRRDNHVCRGCGQRATDVDHIMSKRAGGSDDPRNLQALCHSCHSAKTMVESVAKKARA